GFWRGLLGFVMALHFGSGADAGGVLGGMLRFVAGTLLIGTGVAALAGRRLPARLLLGGTLFRTVYVLAAVVSGGVTLDGRTAVMYAIEEGIAWLLAVYFIRPRVSSFAAGGHAPKRKGHETLRLPPPALPVGSPVGQPPAS